MGGGAAVDGIRSLVLTGKTRQRVLAGAYEAAVKTTFAFPGRLRRDVLLPNNTMMSTVFTPDAAFLVSGSGAFDFPPAEREQLAASSIRNPVSLLKARQDPRFQVTAAGGLGSGPMRRDVLVISIDGERTEVVLDVAGRIIELAFEEKPRGGEPPTGGTRIRYADFRPVDGIVYPFLSEGISANGQGFSVWLESVQVNSPVPPALFERPAAPPAVVSAPPPGGGTSPSGGVTPK